MFIPIRDNVATRRRPVLTIALIVVNCLVFLYSRSLGAEGFRIFTFQFGYIPFELVNATEVLPQFESYIYVTPFTSMFMHGGWMHLIGNMLFLWIYGNNIEDDLGRFKFLVFYLLSGLAAIGLYTLFGPSSQIPLVGASGAIAGVMGAYLVRYPAARITVLVIFIFIQTIQLPAKIVLGFWFIYQIIMYSLGGAGGGGGVAWMAHVGGFAFGWLVFRLLKNRIGGPPQGRAVSDNRSYRVRWR